MENKIFFIIKTSIILVFFTEFIFASLSWKELGVNSPTIQQQWILSGAKTPEEVRKWKSLGMIRPYDISYWFGNGVQTPEEAKRWIDAGFKNPSSINSWKINNVKTPEDAIRWSNVGFGNTPLGKKEWSKLGIITLEEVEKWIDIDIDIKDVKHWMYLGVNTSEEAKEWINLGLDSPIVVERWMDEGIKTSYDARLWLSAGVKNYKDVKIWKENGLHKSEEVKKWINVGATDLKEMKILTSNGIQTFADLSKWINSGITFSNIKTWIQVGIIIPSIAASWMNIGSNANIAKKCMNLGIKTPEELEEWYNIGIYDLNKIYEYKMLGVISALNVEKYELQKTIKTILYQVFIIGFFIILSVTLFMGYGEERKIIIFRDYNDLGLTFLTPASSILLYILFVSVGGNPQYGLILAILIFAFLLSKLIQDSYIDNNKSLLFTFLALITKIPLGIIWVINVMNILNPSGSSALKRRKNRTSAFVILVILTPILNMVVANREGSYFNPIAWINGRKIGRF